MFEPFQEFNKVDAVKVDQRQRDDGRVVFVTLDRDDRVVGAYGRKELAHYVVAHAAHRRAWRELPAERRAAAVFVDAMLDEYGARVVEIVRLASWFVVRDAAGRELDVYDEEAAAHHAMVMEAHRHSRRQLRKNGSTKEILKRTAERANNAQRHKH
jgi:hypothetical protein